MRTSLRVALATLAFPMLAEAQQPVTTAPARSIPARSIPARSIAARALPATIVLDMNGDGVALDGSTRTSLLTGGPVTARWTKAGSDDAFLVVDATSLRAAGVSLMNVQGNELEGMQLLRGGFRVKDPSGNAAVISDGWQMLALLDANGDGKVNASDPAWASLRLFVDANADGKIEAGELQAVAGGKLDGLDAKMEPVTADMNGRARADGSFTITGGETRAMSSAPMTP